MTPQSSSLPTADWRVSPPIELPEGHVGLVELPGTSRRIWWTGRVAIGLRYERPPVPGGLSSSAIWIQDLLLDSDAGDARPTRAASAS